MNHSGAANAGLSLLARAGIPDPRAAAFVPNFQPQATQAAIQGPSLSSRLDPMLPINAPLPSAIDPSTSTHSTDFPSKPLQSSLCRYASACTNPMCEYSHPSPKASLAKRRGEIKEDPILTSQTPCRFGVECNNVECTYSHVSPAVFFLSQRGGNSAEGVGAASTMAGAAGAAAAGSMGESTSIPCRFADKCTNPSCAYKHVDAAGNVVPSPALTRLLNPSSSSATTASGADAEMSENAAQGEEGDGDGDGDVDITTATAAGTGAQSDKGPDGKPLALDRPLDDGAGGAAGGGAKPCKFGVACTREGCWFSHPPGDALSSKPKPKPNSNGSAGAGKVHISDRLSRFNREGGEDAGGDRGGVERIIPAV